MIWCLDSCTQMTVSLHGVRNTSNSAPTEPQPQKEMRCSHQNWCKGFKDKTDLIKKEESQAEQCNTKITL